MRYARNDLLMRYAAAKIDSAYVYALVQPWTALVYSSFVYVISKKAASTGRRFGKKFSSKETVEYNVAQKEYDFSISRRSTIKKSLKMARFEFLAIALIMAIAIQEGKYRHFKIIRTILRGLTLNCGELNESVSYSFEESF